MQLNGKHCDQGQHRDKNMWSCIEIFQDSLGLSGAEGILNQPNASDHLSTKGCMTTNNIKCVNYFL